MIRPAARGNNHITGRYIIPSLFLPHENVGSGLPHMAHWPTMIDEVRNETNSNIKYERFSYVFLINLMETIILHRVNRLNEIRVSKCTEKEKGKII